MRFISVFLLLGLVAAHAQRRLPAAFSQNQMIALQEVLREAGFTTRERMNIAYDSDVGISNVTITLGAEQQCSGFKVEASVTPFSPAAYTYSVRFQLSGWPSETRVTFRQLIPAPLGRGVAPRVPPRPVIVAVANIDAPATPYDAVPSPTRLRRNESMEAAVMRALQANGMNALEQARPVIREAVAAAERVSHELLPLLRHVRSIPRRTGERPSEGLRAGMSTHAHHIVSACSLRDAAKSE